MQENCSWHSNSAKFGSIETPQNESDLWLRADGRLRLPPHCFFNRVNALLTYVEKTFCSHRYVTQSVCDVICRCWRHDVLFRHRQRQILQRADAQMTRRQFTFQLLKFLTNEINSAAIEWKDWFVEIPFYSWTKTSHFNSFSTSAQDKDVKPIKKCIQPIQCT